MDHAIILTGAVLLAALAFDFVNGFHDAANSIATIVATRVLKPGHAVLWAALFNFTALFLFGTGVAKTVGSGMIALDSVTLVVILSGLIGAILWGLLTWWFGLPTSSSHALLGGYAGAAMSNSAFRHGLAALYDPIVPQGWEKTLILIVVAPALGLIMGHALMKGAQWAQTYMPKKYAGQIFKALQLLSSAFLSLMHGSNDAQKTAGIMAGALVAGGYFKEFTIPYWVLCTSYGMLGLGTFFGGWRIVDTLGKRLTRLRPNGGFSAETAASLSILMATLLSLPVSTTHVTTGAILGVGAAQNPRTVHWTVAGRILRAWILTIPAAALMGGTVMWLAALCGG
ncbi:MAG: inorganic phosphate transporter [Pseudomonadota bacterium]|nr:inorganic phosphate transporter [Pseudomonadota bacterium]